MKVFNDLKTRGVNFAAELQAPKPNIFITALDREARVVAAVRTVIPIVFLFGADPVGLGLVKSLARPGG